METDINIDFSIQFLRIFCMTLKFETPDLPLKVNTTLKKYRKALSTYDEEATCAGQPMFPNSNAKNFKLFLENLRM